MKFKVFALLAFVLVLFAYGQAAQAQLTAVGPVNPATGFPTLFTDAAPALVSVGPCDVLNEDPALPTTNLGPCGALALIDWGNPAVPNDGPGFVLTNVEEVTFYRAEAVVVPGNSRLRIEVQGGCVDLPPAPCVPVIINSAGLRLLPANLVGCTPGDFIVDTPVGSFTVPVADVAVGAPAVDLGALAVPPRPLAEGLATDIPAFSGALGGIVDQFVANAPLPAGTPPGFLGDSITPAPLAAGQGWPLPGGVLAFVVTGPTCGEIINTTSFTVEGKVAAFPLTVTLAGNGTGTVTGAPPGIDATINCPGTCTASFAPATVVTLTAAATVGQFTGWTGCTPVPGVPTQCTVTMNLPTNVTATFSAASIAVAPLNGDFGNVNVGSVENMTFTVTNNGVLNVLMGTAVVAGTLTTDFTKGLDTCSGQTILPAGTCSIQVKFLPTAAAAMAGTLTIPSDDPDPAPVIILSGTGTNAQVFNDVLPASPFENHINSLSNNGIALGCTANQFCPQNLVTRGQMSAFIIRASEGEPTATIIPVPMSGDQEVPIAQTAATGTASLIVNLTTGALGGTINFSNLSAGGITLAHIHQAPAAANGAVIVDFAGGFIVGQTTGTVTISGTLTAPQIASLIAGGLYFNIHSPSFPNGEIRGQIVPRFSDVPFNDTFFRHIERMAIRGITLGIGGGRYAPLNNVTRAEMASFIVRAVDGVDATTCLGTVFTDVPFGAPHCANIERLRTLNVTLGCGANLYCPADSVPREQMAAFIARAFLGIP
jgi:hypothetical protein